MNKRFKLYDNAFIYFNGEDELRIKKGIWNFEEATLNLKEVNENIKKAIVFISVELFEDKTVDLDEVHKRFLFTDEDHIFLDNMIEPLFKQRFLDLEDSDENTKFIYELIGGFFKDGFSEDKIVCKPVMFITDNDRLKRYANLISEDINMPLTMMSKESIEKIEKSNLTDTTEAIENIELKDEFLKWFNDFSCVVVSIERPRLKFLRNLNRILLEKSMPIVISILDGPFLNITTVKGKETACYECFEMRVLSRNEDLAAYNNFVKRTGAIKIVDKKTYITPILQTFMSLSLYEAFLLSTIGKCKLAGRVINVYLPIIEIQIQDLLRVPFCPACGHISMAKYNEMYTSSRAVVDSLASKVILTKE